MFNTRSRPTEFTSAFVVLALVYHCTVQSVRASNRNALMALLSNIFQTVIFIAAFYLMFTILGLRGAAIRGDFIVYIMTGIFLFMTHVKTIGAVAKSGDPTASMMKHAPMNTAIAISASAVGALYTQVLSMVVVLSAYHVAFEPVHIENPLGAFGMLVLAWFSGVAVGMVFLAITPWSPGFAKIGTAIYMRANMIFSGKMFVANSLSYVKLKFFIWNPLFHVIDQTRGFAFINYNPHHSSVSYPIYVSLALIMIGLMGEFYTRRHASLSWNAAR